MIVREFGSCFLLLTACVCGPQSVVPLQSSEPLRIVLTFDDGLKDHLLIAAPELEKRGWRGMFNIVTDWIGKGDEYMNWNDVRELVRRGHEVATHTLDHPNLVELLTAGRTNEVRRQLSESRDLIAAQTDFAPRYACAPFVAQNGVIDGICRELGLVLMYYGRHNFGADTANGVCADVADVRSRGLKRIDILHHGVSAVDHGGWRPFRDRASFARHLDDIASMEGQGVLRVTDYDGMLSDCSLKARRWPHHGVLSLSFDDRHLTGWERCFPVFKRYKATATFCISGEIDSAVVSFSRKAMAHGHEIALHGLNHRNADIAISGMGESGYWEEEIEPQLAAFRAAGIPIRSFAYPNCRHNDASDSLFVRHGFTRLRGAVRGKTSPNPYDPCGERLDQWEPIAEADSFFVPVDSYLKDVCISNVILGESYHTDMADVLRAITRAGERGECLSLVSHGISPDARGVNMKLDWLERILAHAGQAGVVVRGLR